MAQPGRPPSTNDLLLTPNGSPVYLGTIVSAGAVQNNATTATPFAIGLPNPPQGAGALQGTLAGRWLLLQPTAAGQFLPSLVVGVGASNLTLAQQTVVPPIQNTTIGPTFTAGERVELCMLPTEGWLQWLPTSGSGNLHVWELR